MRELRLIHLRRELIAEGNHTDWNNTVPYGSDGRCSDLIPAQCSFNHGGFFNDSLSTSWKSPPIPSAAEFRLADKGGLSVAAFGADTILLSNSTDNLTDFAFFTPSSGDLPQSSLGLGRNSTVLQSLFVA